MRSVSSKLENTFRYFLQRLQFCAFEQREQPSIFLEHDQDVVVWSILADQSTPTFRRWQGLSFSSRRRLSGDLAGSPQCPSRFGVGVFAVFEDLHAVHEDVTHTHCELVRFLKRRQVSDRPGIKDNYVSKHAGFEKAAMVQSEIRRGQA